MSRGVRFNLQTRYSVQILGAILVTVVGLSLVSLHELRTVAIKVQEVTNQSFETHLEEQVIERGQVMADYLVQNLANPIVRYDMQAIRELLRTTALQQDVLFAYVFDAEGKIIHDGSPEVMTFGQAIDDILQWGVTGNLAPAPRLLGGTLHIVSPVLLGGKPIGGVAIGMSLDLVSAEISQLRNTLEELTNRSVQSELAIAAVATLLFTLFGTLFALIAGRRLAKPIRELAEMARRVGQGDFDNEFEISRNDEVGDLAKAFSNMSVDLKASNREVRFLAYHDPLTGLSNRARLRDSIGELCTRCRENGSKGAVLFIDLDDFKPVNDTLGHDAGDALLRNAAERLKDCLRTGPGSTWRFGNDETRSIARPGGDEFTIILEGLYEREDASIVAARVLEELCRPFQVQGHEVSIGASIGIATYPDDGRDGESLLSHADVAMYAAKRKGKHAFCFYEETMYERTRDKLFMINDLRRALDDNGFDVHYQPIVGGNSGRTVGAEALVRWHHPERGLINAAEFIEVAEKSGEAERLGRYVLERVCADLASWRKHGIEGLFVSINISTRQLLREDLPDLMTGLLASHGLSPRDLRIEASEQRILSQLGERTSLLHELNQAGFEIWVDQFGSGPASLLNLRRVPARGIKLSREFIGELATDARSRQFVKALIEMASSVNLEVCAVGVTSDAQAAWLQMQGCKYLQGQFIGSELTAEKLPGYLEFQLGEARPLSKEPDLKAL